MRTGNDDRSRLGLTADTDVRGLIYLALGFFVFASGDTIGKFLTSELHPVQIVWSRQAGLMITTLVLLMLKGPSLLRTGSPKLQITRGTLAVLSAICFITAIAYVPLADAVAVTFVAPFMVTIMGALFLQETVGIRRWGAIILGFVGALIIIRPGMGVFHPAIFLVLAAAAFFALRQVLSRMLAASDRTMTTIAYTAIVSFAILSAPLPFVWIWPEETTTCLLLGALAAMAAIGEILIIRALELAQAVVAAPMHYSLIVWASFYGWIVFGQWPDLWTWLGTGMIFATGIYILNHDRIAKNRDRQQTPQ